MRRTRPQFTIRHLMIAVLTVAIPMALPSGWAPIELILAVPFLAFLVHPWLVLRGYRRCAMACYWSMSVIVNVLCIALCVSPDSYLLALFVFLYVLVLVPTIAPFGIAWAKLASREDAVPRREPAAVWISVFLVTALPLMTWVTLWPLRLVFHVTRPALERLADEVAAGRPVGTPSSVGPFRFAGTTVDAATGSVGLWIDPHPSGPAGFVRLGPGASSTELLRLNRGDNLDVGLGWGWWYRRED